MQQGDFRQSWEHEIGDVLWINYNGAEVVARVADYFDSLDNTKPLYVNLRVSDGLRWGQRQVRIQPEQIVRADPEWQFRQHAAWQAQLKKDTEEIYAKMKPSEKRRVHEDAVRLGLAQDRRSPLDIMIDHACGLE